LDEMRMKTAFTPFTLDESSAMHIQSVKCKFALKETYLDFKTLYVFSINRTPLQSLLIY